MKNYLSTHSPVRDSLVSVIVVSCGREDLLSRCLKSIVSQSHQNLECLVVLNNGDEDTALRWKEVYPDFAFEYFSGNELYCRPQNKGIRDTQGDFVLCLNDDIVLSRFYVEEALKAIGLDARIGSVSGCLVREDGVTLDSTGLFLVRSRKPLDRGYGKKISQADSREGYIFGVNGAAAFYRRKMLEDIRVGEEYFDEDFGIYYDDLDIAWRAHRQGWRAYYCPQALAHHKRGGSTRLPAQPGLKFFEKFALANISKELKIRLIRNRYATIIKNDRLSRFLMDLPWILFYELRLWGYLLFFEREVLAEVLENTGYLKRAFAKRKKITSLLKDHYGH